MSEEAKAWERQRDGDGKLEPNRWHGRFTAYRLMGSGRSLLGCVNQEREQKGTKRQNTVPGAWSRAFEKWRWRERAEAWDKAERKRIEAEYESERLEWREKRRKLLQGFFGRLVQALGDLDPADATLGQLTQAVRVAIQELRAEFDDEPTARHDVSIGLDESTRQILAQIGTLAAYCITEPDMKERFVQGMQELIGEDDA